jgi:3-oxoacyl-[acyl-carrier protein] reductase
MRCPACWQRRNRTLEGRAQRLERHHRLRHSVVANNRRVAVITGGARGIGAAIGGALARTGTAVVLADVDEAALTATASDIRGRGGDVTIVVADVRNEDSLNHLRETASDLSGQIDIVVANAAVADRGAIFEGDTALWRGVLETNLLGAALTVRSLAGGMVSRRAGDVVLMASLSGRMSYVGEPLYIASKWGLIGLGHSLRAELAPRGVRVTLIEPGIVRTDLSARDATGRALLASTAPLNADDIAAAVVYVTSQPRGVAVSELVIQPNTVGGW